MVWILILDVRIHAWSLRLCMIDIVCNHVGHIYFGRTVCSHVYSAHTVEHCLIFFKDMESTPGTLYDCST